MDAELTQRSSLRLSAEAKDFVAGAVGGVAAVLAGQPLDTIRIRLQQPGSQGVRAVCRSLIAAEGWNGLFKGMSYPLATNALQNAVTFNAYGVALRSMQASRPKSEAAPGASSLDGTVGGTPYTTMFVCGLFAGFVQTFVSVPVDVLKIRLQLQRAVPGQERYVGPLALLRQVVRSEGLVGLMRGTSPTLARDVPSYGVYFVVYEAMHRLLTGHGGHSVATNNKVPQSHLGPHRTVAAAPGPDPGLAAPAVPGLMTPAAPGLTAPVALVLASPVAPGLAAGVASALEASANLVAGGVAGSVAWLTIYPVDVIKSRVQAIPRHLSPDSTWLHTLARVWRDEGPRALTRGLVTTILRGFVVNGAIFLAAEACQEAMQGL